MFFLVDKYFDIKRFQINTCLLALSRAFKYITQKKDLTLFFFYSLTPCEANFFKNSLRIQMNPKMQIIHCSSNIESGVDIIYGNFICLTKQNPILCQLLLTS